MRNIILLTALYPIAFSSHSANLVDYSQVDLSQILNSPTHSSYILSNQPLAYQDVSSVQTRKKTINRKQQFHYGIPVYAQSLVTKLSDQGVVTPIYGEVVTGIDSDIGSTLPMLNAKQAIELAKGQSSDFVTKMTRDHKTNLVIWLDEQKTAHLAYKVDYLEMKSTGPSRPITFVDAKSGEILDKWEGITFIDAEGPGGNRKSGRYYFGSNTRYGGFEVNQNCEMDSPNVRTIDMNNKQYGGQVHQFDCNVNTYRSTNGAYAPMNDAHYFGQRVFDMYMDWLNTRPIKQKLTMRVHYGSNYGNAFWDGYQMTFGDGNSSMYPLATWDVIAHEVSHGFTEQNSGLEYRGMSGGINESFSDVAAAALSQYVHGSFNWKMGEHVMKYSDAMRYFTQPSKDGRSIDHINQYYNGIDVHHSSGIFNKAFYHLANSENWSIKKAFITYATANQLYWNPNSDFQEGAEGVCKAAQELGYTTAAVNSAFAEVGIQVDCFSELPDTEPTPSSTVTELKINTPSAIQSLKSDEQNFVLKSAPVGDVWVQTYNGYGNVDMYVAIGRPASIIDYDCASTNPDNNEYCGFSGIEGMDVHIMVNGSSQSMHAYVGVSAYLDEPVPEPRSLCEDLEEWSPYYYYPEGTQVQYYGSRYIATRDNWGIDPYNYYWYWDYKGSCYQ
ncbi:M4 family metallopeptidase [Vibrio neptunius]|uniref:Neutral metalloproteinase n=1 Tax=Vibrio neptunius TaxID=170651 RepID=A0ABS3A9B0_9VIBR|nr:M4 family metallopeptidase [Vibrio neptunius]MBN3495820.1 M4 family metallopeptidase [Vibrio neptunius]MBN3518241.1 M4 family metallopeptidase [Vibrio neptunius]MBN3552572.1 M4 family metallopeptidase [Vibrio neptunius]MBN3580509.1 M4 family metallopeptidase [Vibrio neptunius]MCH9874176.1 M4 family metallopeptidase [Vibrio neptunius]